MGRPELVRGESGDSPPQFSFSAGYPAVIDLRRGESAIETLESRNGATGKLFWKWQLRL